MRLHVHHATHYTYEARPAHIVQRLLLEPSSFASQRVINWTITAPGIETGLKYRDGIGNWVHLITSKPTDKKLTIVAEGEVESEDTAGVVKGLPQAAPEPVFLRTTPATTADARLMNFALGLPKSGNRLEMAHAMMQAIHQAVAYLPGTSHAHTTAAEAFGEGSGVCQDHAHIMLTAARLHGIPARYVTGYLMTGTGASSTAAHAWAELLIPDLGWVGFDAANNQCPTDHYVRVAAGLDALAVAPVRGSRRGSHGKEDLTVEVRVEISQQ
jgi:transglutaminase-like putative cysteine protease